MANMINNQKTLGIIFVVAINNKINFVYFLYPVIVLRSVSNCDAKSNLTWNLEFNIIHIILNSRGRQSTFYEAPSFTDQFKKERNFCPLFTQNTKACRPRPAKLLLFHDFTKHLKLWRWSVWTRTSLLLSFFSSPS